MSDIITLSSSDEEDVQPPPKKKIKPSPVNEMPPILKCPKKTVSDIVILSDDETENIKLYTNITKNGYEESNSENSRNMKDDNYSIIVPDDNETLINDNQKEKVTDVNDRTEDVEEVVIDENSSAGSSGKENNLENSLPNINKLNGPSTSKLMSAHDELLENFLKVCEESIAGSQYEPLKNKEFFILRKYYKKCGAKLCDSSNFLKLIDDNTIRAKKSPATAVIGFNEIYQYIKQVVDAESIEVTAEHRLKLKKLEKTIKLLLMRIKQLENSELNFDDEEDSTYLQLDRYMNRLNKVYKKYCELLKKNPYSGRITYEKLDFVDSEYNEINRAISKKYKNNEKFPSYFEMEEYIRKVTTDYKLDLSESKIKSESIRCFKKLGELLQNRRKKELYDAHYLYIRDTEDPANVDNSLDTTLKQSFVDGQVNIEKICEEFTVKEELGEETVLSEEDSDDSGDEESENEGEVK